MVFDRAPLSLPGSSDPAEERLGLIATEAVTVIPRRYCAHSQFIGVDLDVHSAGVGVQCVPQEFGDGLNRRGVRQPAQMIVLDLHSESAFRHSGLSRYASIP